MLILENLFVGLMCFCIAYAITSYFFPQPDKNPELLTMQIKGKNGMLVNVDTQHINEMIDLHGNGEWKINLDHNRTLIFKRGK